MQKKLTVLTLLCFVAVALASCSTAGPSKLITFWPQKPNIANSCPHEKQYVVCGRVLDNQCLPIESCKVVLIKRKFGVGLLSCGDADKKGTTLAEIPVAVTDQTGDYSLCFEPLGANDVWLYFDASAEGFNPQFVELNHLMGPTIFQTPGNNPVVVDMTLERTM
jgi:hypothetical protein